MELDSQNIRIIKNTLRYSVNKVTTTKWLFFHYGYFIEGLNAILISQIEVKIKLVQGFY